MRKVLASPGKAAARRSRKGRRRNRRSGFNRNVMALLPRAPEDWIIEAECRGAKQGGPRSTRSRRLQARLFYLVGAAERRDGKGQTERVRGLLIDDQMEPG